MQSIAQDSLDFISDPPPDPVPAALGQLYAGRSIDRAAARSLFSELVAGRLTDPEIASMLVALRVKGETAEELVGAGQALRAADVPFERPDYLFADCCGTGGDGSGSINVSTAAAFVAAAAGLPVAKHGNRSFSSRCGSADVLEQLGAKLELSPKRSRQILDDTGICFLFAPLYHPGLKHAGPVRRTLKVRTIMNLLGPCLNPAEPPVQLLGVAEPRLLETVARALRELGVARALVVHGAGLDEVALHGPTRAVRLVGGELDELIITPFEAGLVTAPASALTGGDPRQNAERLRAILSGDGSSAERNVVALNAGALLMIAGIAADLAEGVRIASQQLRSGTALGVLRRFIEATND